MSAKVLTIYRDALDQWWQSQDPSLPETEASKAYHRRIQRKERMRFLQDIAPDGELYEHYYDQFAQDDPGFADAMERYTEGLILDLLAVLEVPRVRH